MKEEKDTSIIRFHKCTEPGFQEHTEPSVRCQECTETSFQEYTEPSVRFQECTEMGFCLWQATPTCSPTPTGHIHSSTPSH